MYPLTRILCHGDSAASNVVTAASFLLLRPRVTSLVCCEITWIGLSSTVSVATRGWQVEMDQMTKCDLRISASVRTAETQDGAVLLDVKQGLCFNVNPVGALIWKRICEGLEPRQIADHLVQLFDISPDQATSDVHEFLKDLKHKQLIHERGSPANQTGRRHKFADRLSEFLPKLFRSRATYYPK